MKEKNQAVRREAEDSFTCVTRNPCAARVRRGKARAYAHKAVCRLKTQCGRAVREILTNSPLRLLSGRRDAAMANMTACCERVFLRFFLKSQKKVFTK